jgi:hypothetical protein
MLPESVEIMRGFE